MQKSFTSQSYIFRKVAAILVFSLVMNACSGQNETKFEITELNDIDYLEGRSIDSLQRLNLVLPEKIENYPLLIWIGGGAWSYGDRNVEMDLARKFAQEGIAVASVGHRLSAAKWRDTSLSTGVRHPEHIKDIASSVKWLYENESKYAYDRAKIFIGGFSSGAHLTALIGLDDSYLKKVGLSRNILKGLIPISGTYDIVNYHEVFKNGNRPELATLHVEAVFGNTKQDFVNASPTSYLKNLSIPMLVISDNALERYTKLFEKRIEETDFKNFEVIYAPDLNHGELWKNISFLDTSRYRSAIIEFIKKNS